MTSYIRVLHASPDAPSFDLYDHSGGVMARGLVYSDFTEYLPVHSGSCTVRCIPRGAEEPLWDNTFSIPENSVYTVTASGEQDNIKVLTISESPMYIPPYRACLRFANLCCYCPGVDVYLYEGNTLCRGIAYGGVSDYMTIYPGKYTLRMVDSKSGNVILTVPNQTFYSGRYHTAYSVGRHGHSSLRMLTPLDGISYLRV